MKTDLQIPTNIALKEALDAAARGWFVFPIARNTKVPPKGFTDWEHRASSNPEQIKAWAKILPDCNWAVACGPSGLIVIDVDVKRGKPGKETLAALEVKHGPLPPCRIAITPSGGLHYYFSGVCSGGEDKLGPGVDIKSDGGYVLLPGSKTKEGGYQWLTS